MTKAYFRLVHDRGEGDYTELHSKIFQGKTIKNTGAQSTIIELPESYGY